MSADDCDLCATTSDGTRYFCMAHRAQFEVWHNAQAWLAAHPTYMPARHMLAPSQPLALPPRRTLRRAYGVAL